MWDQRSKQPPLSGHVVRPLFLPGTSGGLPDGRADPGALGLGLCLLGKTLKIVGIVSNLLRCWEKPRKVGDERYEGNTSHFRTCEVDDIESS